MHVPDCIDRRARSGERRKRKVSFKNKQVVITGILFGMTREEAIQLVEDQGGLVQATVTKRTNILIVGNRQMDLFNLDKVSRKKRVADQLIAQGVPIEVIDHETFLNRLSSS